MAGRIRIVFILGVFLLIGIDLAPAQNSPRFGIGGLGREMPDSTRLTLKLPSPFISPRFFWLPLDTKQLLQNWAFEHRHRIQAEVSFAPWESISEETLSVPDIDWNTPSPIKTTFGIDYRTSSLYVPVNVQEYQEYLMGRSRYFPLGSLAAAAYLANKIYGRYGYLLRKKEENRYVSLDMTDDEIRMMQFLWDQPGLMPTEWYSTYQDQHSQPLLTYMVFQENITDLENKYLINPRKFPNDRVLYYPAITANDLIFRLKDELSGLDGQHNAERIMRIRYLIQKLGNF
ncbi:MAG: hypothetical protein P8184_16210 [Calditrichia bacterium]